MGSDRLSRVGLQHEFGELDWQVVVDPPLLCNTLLRMGQQGRAPGDPGTIDQNIEVLYVHVSTRVPMGG